jgi:predicted ArsR family transcriptional regulator
VPSSDRLAVLKTLGDNTRYAIYLELARSPRSLSVAEIADELDLHANTVRPHLERMREVGLVDYEAQSQGVGRPQHRYFLAPEAPALGLEPSTFRMLARLLAQTARVSGAAAEDVTAVGREQGRLDGALTSRGRSCLEALVDRLDELGFDPAVIADEDTLTIGFGHCPFAEVASAYPEVVCALHRGMVEGFVEADPRVEVTDFGTYVDRNACQVSLAAR